MRLFYWGMVSVLVVGLVCGVPAVAASSDVVISEIMAYPTTPADEWVEIVNRGSNPVDMTGWVFYENATRHGLKPVGQTLLMPGAYAIIAENSTTFVANHPSNSALVFDSSWSTGLSGSGEQIGLKDAGDSFVELFIYPSSTHGSLERINLFDSATTTANWLERTSGDSAGINNSARSTAAGTSSTLGGMSTTTIPVPTTTTSSNTISTTTRWAALRINEVLPAPTTGTEWVELYNPENEALDVAGGILCDDRTTVCTIATLSGVIPAQGFLVVNIAGSKLNNDGDTVILKNPDGEIIDRSAYGSSTVMPLTGEVLVRSIDGAGEWVVSILATPGTPNTVRQPPQTVAAASGGGATAARGSSEIIGSTEDTIKELALESVNGSKGIIWYATTTAVLKITELLPNPSGDDTREEFVELQNQGLADMNLQGIKLSIDGLFYNLSGELDVGESLLIKRATSHLELQNATSSLVRLLNQDLAILDEIVYPHPAPSGLSYTKIGPHSWRWLKPSPRTVGAVSAVVWRPGIPRTGLVNEPVIGDIGALIDPRGGSWVAQWMFDGHEKKGSRVSMLFASPGTYTIAVQATSTMGTTVATTTEISISDDNTPCTGNIQLSEVYAHPTATDDEQFVEIINHDTRPVRLDGWRLYTTARTAYSIPEDTVLAPGAMAVFYESITHLSLNEKGGTVRLLDETGNVLVAERFPATREGFSYQRINGVWTTGSAASPGHVLIVPDTEAVAAPEISVKKQTKTVVARSKNVAKKGVVRTKTVAKKSVLHVVTLSDSAKLPKGTLVQTEGIVTVAPGIFGDQYCVLTDEDGGAFVYQSKKNFPPLSLGDRIRVQGVISESSGRKRISLSGSKNIDILSTNNRVEAIEKSVADISSDDVGLLVQVSGELTSKTTNRGFLDDGTEEIPFSLKKGAAISTKNWRVGERITMAGIVVATKNGVELWPRQLDDVQHTVSTTVNFGPAAASVPHASSATTAWPSSSYIIIGGLLLTNAGLLWRLVRQKTVSKPTT